MKKIHFLSIETETQSNIEKNLIESSRINNIDLHIIGRGVKWDGFITKFQILKEYLLTISEDIVCLTDSRDVLYMSDSKKIYNTFIKNFSKDCIVFNGETNCFPEKSFAELHPNQSKKYKYLNSGCVIGSRILLIEIVDKCLELYDSCKINDDQYLLQKIFLDGEYGDAFTIDYDCKIFQCIWDEDYGRSNNFDLVYTQNEIYNRLTDTYPLIFHYPGPTCTGSQVWKILNKKYYKIPNTKYYKEKKKKYESISDSELHKLWL
jgi:hypothetical protein